MEEKEAYIQTYMNYHWVDRAEAIKAVNKSIAHCEAEMAKHMPKITVSQNASEV